MHGLMCEKTLLRVVLAAGILLSLFFTSPGYGETPEISRDVALSTQELKELVDLMENPEKRDAFVRNLKGLIELRQSAAMEAEKPPERKARQVLSIDKVFLSFEALFKKVLDSATSTGSLVARAPGSIEKAKAFFSEPQNRFDLVKLFGNIAGSIVIAVLVGLLLRKYVPKSEERERSLSLRIAVGSLRIVLSVLPYAVLLVCLFILLGIFPSLPLGRSLVLLIFSIIFFYRLALAILGVLLSPEDEETRILPLGAEDAGYFWVWAVRFTNYTAFYLLVTRTLLVIGVASSSFFFIRGVLLIVFPLMLSVFIMQIAKEIRTRYEGSSGNPDDSGGTSKKFPRLLAKYCPVLAIAYSWIVFIFLIVRYEKGFSYLFQATLSTVVTIVAIYCLLRVLDRVFDRLFAVNERIKARFPGLEKKTNQYIRILRKGLGIVVVFFGLGVIIQVWGIPVSALIASRTGSLVILRIIAIIITLGVVIGIIEMSQYISDRLIQERKGRKLTKKRKTFIPLMNTTVKIGVAFIGGIVILDQMGVNTKPILAGAGIVGLAVGFGAQTLVKDVINGLFILLQDLISVGDVAVLGNKGGLVEAVGLRTVTLRDLSGNVHVIPNSAIETVTNMTKGYSRYVFDVGVAYREDVDEVMNILREIGEEMQNDPTYGKDILEPLEVLGVDSFADSAVIIRARITTKPIRQWAVGREFNRRMKKVFDERGIEIPFPHQTIYMGEPKEGPAPALEVHLQGRNASPGEKKG